MNPRAAFDGNTISSRARYDHFDTTAYKMLPQQHGLLYQKSAPCQAKSTKKPINFGRGPLAAPFHAIPSVHLLSNGKYIAVIGMEKFMDAQFEKSARCNVDYDKEGTPRKGTRYVSPAVIQI